MADLKTTPDPVAAPGAYYPQDFSIETISVITSGGQIFELKQMLVEMSYFEDIYTFATSGYLNIKDSQNFIESLQLNGTEFIRIKFAKIKDAPNTIDKTFHLYKIGNRVPSGNMNTYFYTMHFCSEELVLSEQTRISKAIPGQEISKAIRGILKNNLKVKDEKIAVIEDTTGVYDFVIPRMKPFEAISWLSTYARPKATGGYGADMLFFENKFGYNYRSLQSMFSDNVYATYKYQQSNIDEKKQSFQDRVTSVLNYEFVKTFDILKDVNAGVYANRLISVDLLARKSTTTNFNLKEYFSRSKHLNKNDVLNPLRNRLGSTQNESYESLIKVATSNTFQNKEKYVKQTPGSVAHDIAIENYVPLRTAQLSLANYTVVKMTIPGDPGITAGRTINFNLMTTKPSISTGAGISIKELDKFYSGKYLVTAVRHIIQYDGAFQTVLEIAKGSSVTPYNPIENNNLVIKKETEK